jgi:hypothetical protein
MSFAARNAIAGIAAALATSPALAAGQWSYAVWGMTATDLIAASGGQAQAYQPQPGDSRFGADQLAVAQFRQDDIEYEVRFLFSKPWYQLQAIELAPDKSRCGDVKASFADRLGEARIDRREFQMGPQMAVTLQHSWVSPKVAKGLFTTRWVGLTPTRPAAE